LQFHPQIISRLSPRHPPTKYSTTACSGRAVPHQTEWVASYLLPNIITPNQHIFWISLVTLNDLLWLFRPQIKNEMAQETPRARLLTNTVELSLGKYLLDYYHRVINCSIISF
jgi:hypothetical protein